MAGSGKRFLIKCLVKAVRTPFGSSRAVQVVCPTGSSANIISGVTLQSFLKVPTIENAGEMKPPGGSVGAALQENCHSLRVLLVDERSLVGLTTIGWMEHMCYHGMASLLDQSASWDGLPVVVFLGDDIQLPPVCDLPVYKNGDGMSPAGLHGALVWKEFETVANLQHVVRQANDEQVFRSVLIGVREQKVVPEQARWLQQFQLDRLKQYGDSLLKQMEY